MKKNTMKIKQYNLTVETSGNKWWRNFQSKDGHVRSEHIRHTTLLLMTWTAVRPTYARTDAIRWSTALSTGDLSHENDIIVGWELELLHLIAVLWNRGNCRLLLVSELLQLVKDRVSARISDFFGCTYDLEQHVVLYFKSLRRRLLFRIYKGWHENPISGTILYPSLPVTATKQLPGATTLTTWGQNNINKLQWGDDWMSLTEKKGRKYAVWVCTIFFFSSKNSSNHTASL